MSVQFHLKSHSLSRSPEAVQAINKTVESRHAHACNTPGKSKLLYFECHPFLFGSLHQNPIRHDAGA